MLFYTQTQTQIQINLCVRVRCSICSQDNSIYTSAGEVAIVNGTEADINVYGYTVALAKHGVVRAFCSDSLITKTVVLSAGHCVKDPRYRINARVGHVDIFKSIVYTVQKSIAHANENAPINDIGLFVLSKPVSLTKECDVGFITVKMDKYRSRIYVHIWMGKK